MDTKRTMEEKLWDYIDGNLAPEENSSVEELVKNDMAWKTKYRELLDIHQLVHSSELDAPSLRFTKNVMEEISRLHIAPATRTYINKKIIWSIGFFFIALMVGLLVYGFSQMNFAGGGESVLSEKLGKVDVNKFFNNTFINIFMMVNVVIGLVLLDHYLGNKRREMRKQTR